MQNKKLIILIVLSVIAVISLIYGITSPPKRRSDRTAYSSFVQLQPSLEKLKTTFPVKRRPKRSNYVTWGRNPFAKKEVSVRESVELALNGIMWDESNPIAIINNDMFEVGDKIAENTIVEIRKDRVILNDGTKDFELRLPQ